MKKNPITIIFTATKTVFSQNRAYWFWFAVFFVLALMFFVLVPVWSVPGNTIAFQLSLFTLGNWVLFVILAPLISMLLTMQIFIFVRAKRAKDKAKSLGSGAVGGYAGVLGAVFATAACSWCVAAVFGFLGTGAVLFIAQNQLWSVLVAVAIMLISLYFTSKKVVKNCGCGVEPISGIKGINNQNNAL